jgi:PHD/YefM family antitoxin component YafN of YafNO toxin-antitoxin module
MPCSLREIRNIARSKGLCITMKNWENYVMRDSQYYAVFQELILELRKIRRHIVQD